MKRATASIHSLLGIILAACGLWMAIVVSASPPAEPAILHAADDEKATGQESIDGSEREPATARAPVGVRGCRDAAAVPRVCAEEIAPPAPFGTLDPAPVLCEQPGLAAEWFVAPGAFNMPQEVLLTPEGELLVEAVRSSTLFHVAGDGTVTPLAENVSAYSGDVDAQGNVYLYNDPAGILFRVAPSGTVTVVVESPEIQTACSSGFGFGPDGKLYVALNPCGPQSDLMQINTAGVITRVAEAIPSLVALRTAPDGRFLAAEAHAVAELSLEDYSLTPLAVSPGPEPIAPGGLAVDDRGHIFFSTGSRSPGGHLYRLGAGGQITMVAEIPENGLSGIEWLPDSDEIVGGQLRQGGLIAVGPQGALREIVPGSGLVTPMGMAFSPCGELAVANDDGEMMALVDPGGKVSWFFDYVSFTPPMPFVAFDASGTLYASEGCPSCPERVVEVPPGGTPRPFVAASMPSGLAAGAGGTLFVSETGAGRITQVSSDLSTTVLFEGLDYPQALALDIQGDLYVVTGTGGYPLDDIFTVPGWGDTIVRIAPGGGLTTVVTLTAVSDLAVGPTGDLYAATVYGGSIVRVAPEGTLSPVASGLQSADGLAFDLAGNLYVSDAFLNGIVRIGGFPQGTLRGTVTEAAGSQVAATCATGASGTPIGGARVQVLSDWPIVAGQVVTTSTDGRFSLPAAPRPYSLVVTAQGYVPATLDGILVVADQETVCGVELQRYHPVYLPLVLRNAP